MLQFKHHLPHRILHSASRVPLIFLQLGSISHIHTETDSISDNNLSQILQGRIPRRHLLQIHGRIYRLYSHQNNLIATRLIGKYHPSAAIRVFNTLQNPNIFPFNAIIRVLAEQGLSLNAFCMFKELKKCVSLLPNDLTFSFLLKACSSSKDGNDVLISMKQVHCDILKLGFVSDSFVCNGLLWLYATVVKDLLSARKLFDEMPDKGNSVNCWTSLISGYARVRLAVEALELFIMLLMENDLQPENDTMVSVLSACSSLKNTLTVDRWVNEFTRLVKDLPCSKKDYVNIALVYLYGKLKKTDNSRAAFNEISNNGRSSVLSWNVMIGAYVQNNCDLKALSLFKSMMKYSYCHPNHVTMVSVLSACAEVGDLDLGIWIHEYIRTRGQKSVLSSNMNLATTLIDTYCKCGSLDRAWKVFDQMSKKDVVSFNAMIMGLAINGKGLEALKLFHDMQELQLNPDSGTFLGVLYACSHSGLLEQGREIFDEMIGHNSFKPRLEHYACYVDLLARSGFIEEALKVVSKMPFQPNNFVWGALLSGCSLHNKPELAESISAKLVSADPHNSAGYVLLSNSFAADCQWKDVSKLRGVMKEKGVAKQPGCSWININGVVHEFLAGSVSYVPFGSVHQITELLLKEMQSSSSHGVLF